MCLSQVGKLLYLSLMFVIFCCTVVGTFTPHWRDLYKAGGSGDSIGHIGLKGGCDMSSDTEEPYNSYCTYWDDHKPKYENTVKGFLYAAMAIQIFAMGWVMLSCLAFCYHSRFMHALSGWSALILMCLAVAVIAFLANKEKTIQLGPNNDTFEMTVKIGYSFDLIAAATACSIISIVVGAMTSWLSDQPFC
uniref:Uncharacterized protein n=1 Tax=Panagrolaimus davidi TaxID=227884 RepID=A0A914P802_9BILA